MQILPDNATVSATANSTYFGYQVSFPNGTTSYYSLGVCPSPVHQLLYNVVSNVSEDPRFVSAESGARFVVDPVNSLSSPQGNGNGSIYAVLIFNDLNLSDTIYPCNLQYVYKNPISSIYVIIPMTNNGSLVYQNESVSKYPGSDLNYNCPTETGIVTYAKSQIPQNFNLGNFTFDLVGNGTNYNAGNGTSYPGYDYAFNVTYPSQNLTALAVFTWPSASALSQNQEPTPFLAAPYQGYAVMRWFTNSTGLYLIVTTRA